MNQVEVYTFGLCHCSVCVPKDMSRADVEAGADVSHKTGLDHGWKISADKTFKGGEPNPCVCSCNPNRLHYLMVC